MGRTLTGASHVPYPASEGEKFNTDTTLVAVTCATCGILHAIPESLYDSARRWKGDRSDGWKLVCPLGHEWWYVGETEIERQRRLTEAARNRAARMAAQAEQARADAKAQKAAKTRFKNERDRERQRTAAGRCPCCDREFKQLAQHMKRQHPDYPPREP